LAICGLLAVASGHSAIAAEPGFPVLRGSYEVGPPTYRDWSGFYIGGHAGAATTSVNFSVGVSELVANILRFTTVQDEFHPSQWANLPKQAVTRASYGGFAGYNVQYDDLIVGIEAGYSRTSASMSSGDTVSRIVNTSDGYSNTVTVSGTGSVHLTDYATLRARFGWIANGLLPYGFVGAAFGRASVLRTASVTYSAIDADPACAPCLPPIAPFTETDSVNRHKAIAYGWTLGAGADWAILPNVFLRGEYEYVAFAKLNGADIRIGTVRAGAGIRF
jgi:opacity protein-like surface antigen